MFQRLCALYVYGVHSLRRLFSLKGNLISFLEIAELHTYESLAVKEQVFLQAFGGDESKTLVSQFLDCTGHFVASSDKDKAYVVNRLFSTRDFVNEYPSIP